MPKTATGPRLLANESTGDSNETKHILAKGLQALCNATKASSVHVTFAGRSEWQLLAGHGFLQRTDQQFHWQNRGYQTFDELEHAYEAYALFCEEADGDAQLEWEAASMADLDEASGS